jgi:hypothetical protein
MAIYTIAETPIPVPGVMAFDFLLVVPVAPAV